MKFLVGLPPKSGPGQNTLIHHVSLSSGADRARVAASLEREKQLP